VILKESLIRTNVNRIRAYVEMCVIVKREIICSIIEGEGSKKVVVRDGHDDHQGTKKHEQEEGEFFPIQPRDPIGANS